MLPIRKLFVVSLLACLLLAAALAYLAINIWILPKQQQQVLTSQQEEISSLNSLIAIQQRNIDLMTADYSKRDELEAFLRLGRLQFVSAILTPDFYETLNIGAVAIFDRERQPLYSALYEQPSLNLNYQPLARNLAARPELFNNQNAVNKLVRFQSRPYFLSAHPIENSGGQLHNGWLMIMTPVTSQLLDDISLATRLQIQRDSEAESSPLPQKSILAPVSTISSSRSLCYIDNNQPALCLHLTHVSALTETLDRPMLMTILLASLIPTLLALFFLGLLIQQVMKIVTVIRDSTRSGSLKPILQERLSVVSELNTLTESYNLLVDKVLRQQIHLETLSLTDSLTCIANRLAFDKALDDNWKRIQRRPHSIALLMIDIDYFKPYNDHYGHQQGDLALTRVAHALLRCAQRTDELVARYGGEEFAMIVYLQDATELNQLRHRLKEAIADLGIRHDHSKVSPYLTVSAGICWIPDTGPWLQTMSSRDWLRLADVALYQAKACGRNCSMIQVIDHQLQNSQPNLPDSFYGALHL